MLLDTSLKKELKEQGFSVFWSYRFAFKNEVLNQFFLTKLWTQFGFL